MSGIYRQADLLKTSLICVSVSVWHLVSRLAGNGQRIEKASASVVGGQSERRMAMSDNPNPTDDLPISTEGLVLWIKCLDDDIMIHTRKGTRFIPYGLSVAEFNEEIRKADGDE